MQVVEVDVAVIDAELAADALWQAGASAVSEEALASGRVRLRADVSDPSRLAARWAATVVEPDTEAHLDAWRAFARPHWVGRILVQPSWVADAPVEDGDLVVRLDPGRAFGSGSHASTRLALLALQQHLRRGDRVLDVGCGSGVLAVTAALLGASEVTAIDIEAAAVRATEANATANRVTVAASTNTLAEVEGRFAIVLANIGAAVLTDLAGALVARLTPGGHLVLAGLLEAQAERVRAAYSDCAEVERVAAEGWVALVLRRLSPPRP